MKALNNLQLQAYTWISLTLALPVLLWPLMQWVVEMPHEATITLLLRWKISAALLITVAVTADSILTGVARQRNIIIHACWIIITCTLVSLAMRLPQGLFICASLLALHALRSAYPLWFQQSQAWLWVAWIRDTAAALIMFTWLAVLH